MYMILWFFNITVTLILMFWIFFNITVSSLGEVIKTLKSENPFDVLIGVCGCDFGFEGGTS